MTGAPVPSRNNTNRLLGDLPDFRKNPLDFWIGLSAQAPIVKIRFGPAARHVISDPECAQHVLQKNYANYTKDQRLKKILEAGTGPVLATSDGDDWRWRRKLMQPTFKRPAIAHFSDDIIAHTERLIATWRPGDVIDMVYAMKTLTMNIIGQTMFSVDFTETSGDLHHAYGDFGRGLVRRATQILRAPLWAPTKNNREFLRAISTMKEFLSSVLEERRRNPVAKPDLLNMMLTHRLEENDRRFKEDELIHEMSAIVFAGHETTATALSWVFGLLAQHPETQARLLVEIEDVLQGRPPSPGDLKNMPFLEQVIEETLRLYPPLYINSRQAIDNDVIGSFAIGAGSRVLINIVGIHRNENHWPNPARFDPDRFSPNQGNERHSFAHIPFLKGPRICVGSSLAMLELQTIVPLVLQRFTFSLGPGEEAEPEAGVVLQPRGGLRMKVQSRKR